MSIFDSLAARELTVIYVSVTRGSCCMSNSERQCYATEWTIFDGRRGYATAKNHANYDLIASVLRQF